MTPPTDDPLRKALDRVNRTIAGSRDDVETFDVSDIMALRDAALAAAPQPMGCGYPCGYDCNGACFDVAAAPQPAPADREALVEVIRKQTRKHMLNWTVRDIGEVADALLARGLRLPGGGETMAWAVVGEDGEVIPGSIYPTRDEAERVCDYEGERVVRVAIRKLDE